MKFSISIFIFISFLSFKTYASPPTLGLGVIVGSPTGISANYKLTNSKSIDGALAFDFSEDKSNFHLHFDYLWLLPKSIAIENLKFGWYWGLGLKYKSLDNNEKNYLGPRVPLGINYEFRKIDFEVFSEVSLIMNLIPKTDVDINIGLGLRYYF